MELGNPSKRKRSRKVRNLHEHLVEENEEPEMMIEIWKKFPEDLLEVMLTWLPIAVLFRCRVVCRRWNSLVTSIRFQQRLGEVAPTKQPWFFVKDGGISPGSLYDPFTKKWIRDARMPFLALANTFPLTFAEGLVCYLNIRHTSFFIGNLFNQCWRGLPCTDSAIIKMMVGCGFSAIGMVNVSNKDGLTSSWRSKIVLVDKRGNYEVFTTSNDATSESQPMITGKMPSHIRVPSYLNPSALTIGTKLLFLGSSPHGIISHNMKNGEWEQILLPKPFNSSDLALIECNGCLLLTGAVWNGNKSTISVHIWKLYRRVMMWMEIDLMPNSLCSEFQGKVGVTYECLCNKSVILILLKTSRMSRLYTYDVMSREWSKVPKLSLPNKRRTTINGGTRFFPGFTMP